jgi:hypothetical protein
MHDMDAIINFLTSVYNHMTSAQVLAAFGAVKVAIAAYRAKAAKYEAEIELGIKTALAKLKGEAVAADAKVDSFASYLWAQIKVEVKKIF